MLILLLLFLSAQKQQIVQSNYSFISTLGVFWPWCVYLCMFRGIHAAFQNCAISPCGEFFQCISSMPVLSRSVELLRFILVCYIVCTHNASIVATFVIAWQFDAQSEYFLSYAEIFTNFVGGVKLAWFRWRFLVTYPWWRILSMVQCTI